MRFVGEPIAAVVAASEEEAEDIADLVEVAIDETTPVIDARAALAAGAPQMHAEAPGNVILEGKFKTPDFDAVWNGAAKIVKIEARSHRQNATPMEARAGHAAYDAATGRVTLTCTTQMPHLMRTAIADVLGMPESDLRVIAPDVGGGFGQKMSLCAEYVVLVWLARKLKSSVAWTEDRRENLIAVVPLRAINTSRWKAPSTRTPSCSRCTADIVSNVGAYSCFPTTCGVEPLMAMAEMPGPYDVRHYECCARGVFTNTCTMAAYRGVSRPVITFTLERLMDKAAAAFGIDPIDIRRRNLIDKFPYTSAIGPGVRRGHLQADAGDGGEGHRRAGLPQASGRSARARAAISASALRPSPSAPATAVRPSPRAAWRSRPAGRPSSSPSIRPASSRRASAPRRTARACAPRWRRSSPTRSASRPT